MSFLRPSTIEETCTPPGRRVVVVTVTDLAVECVRVLQWGEAVGLRRGVGPAATGIAATSGRGGPPAVLAAVGKLALKAKNRMTLDCVVC